MATASGVIALVLGLAGPAAAQQPGNTAAAAVTVQADQPVATLDRTAVGANTPIWNPNLTHPVVPGLIRRAGLRTLVFNGGGVSDLYHWADGSLSTDPDAAHHPDWAGLPPQFSFDQFAGVARSADASALVHVNYGTGTPAEAAGWVRYANKIRHYGVRDWEVGEEVYLNGFLPGANLEPDAHADKSPEAYAQNVVAYAAAMKAVDPGIRIGIGIVPLRPAPSPFRTWDETVLRIAGPAIDFVDLHWFPSAFVAHNQASLLGSAQIIPTVMATTRAEIDQYAGPNGPHIAMVIGETNSSVADGADQIAPFNGLFLADQTLTLLDNSAESVDMWALHNGFGGNPVVGYGDLGLLASGVCADGNCPPPPDTPYPPYFAMRLLTEVAGHGGQLLRTSSADGLVHAHASRRSDGALAVLLTNTDPANAHDVSLDVTGCAAARGVEVWSLQPGDTDVRITREPGSATGVRTLPPYSLTLVMTRSD
jgi:hypothetical protein